MNTHQHGTDRRPPACHYDRALHQRVTHRHADDCPSLTGPTLTGDSECPAAERGCQPCQAQHCLVCGREHTTTARPDTCIDCETLVAQDLTDLATAYDALADEATSGGSDGRLVAAAAIPGGDAQVLRGPTVPLPAVRFARTLHDDHRATDPMPPLAVLAQWEDIYRAWLDHGTRAWRAASVASAIRYLHAQLPYIANHATTPNTAGILPPDFLAFTRQIRSLRAELENRLHDERVDEEGVACFECGDRLVRRFRPRQTCKHPTPAREHLAARLKARPDALALIDRLTELRLRYAAGDDTATAASIGRYSLFPTRREYYAALLPSPVELAAALLPCKDCSQGGIDDPAAGRSWECPGCRKTYDRSEYAYAVRTSVTSGDGTGWWATLQAAADAVSDITGRNVTAGTIRTWIEREDNIAVACKWHEGTRFGVQIVSWPDVLARATETRTRGRRTAVAS